MPPVTSGVGAVVCEVRGGSGALRAWRSGDWSVQHPWKGFLHGSLSRLFGSMWEDRQRPLPRLEQCCSCGVGSPPQERLAQAMCGISGVVFGWK